MAERGVDLELVSLDRGLSVEELDGLIGSRDYKQFLNTRNALYREMGMKANPPSRSEALRLMAENPNLIKRPLTVRGAEIVLGNAQDQLAEMCAD